MDFFTAILYPIEWIVALIWVGFYKLLTFLGMSDTSGWTWCLAIAGVVVVIRSALIPLFVKQIHSSRRMQLIQPEIQKIQKKYKGRTDRASREAMTREQMELFKKAGTNPFGSCLPILVQLPIFFALYQVLGRLGSFAAGHKTLSLFGINPLTADLARKAEASTIWGVKLSDKMMPVGSQPANVVILCLVLVVVMSITQFISSWQMFRQNMPPSALDNPMAKTNQIMMYAMPIVFGITGVNFPLGTLVYWFFSNVWSMGQQYIVIKNMPTPGSPAYEKMKARKAKKGKEHKELTLEGLLGSGSGATPVAEDGTAPAEGPIKAPSTQRQQPVGKKRAKKKR